MNLTQVTRDKLRPWVWIGAILVAVFCFYLLAEQNQTIDRNAKRSDYNTCLGGNDTRKVISDLITVSLQNNSGFDYSSIPSFAALPPEMKKYLLDISALQRGAEANTAIRDYVNDKLPQKKCDEILRGKPATVITINTR